jgi:hypothetical protein
MCYPIPNPPSDVLSGGNATIQIMYTADFETDKNETYYACADITYVPTNEFTYQVPCFNVSTEDGIDMPEDSPTNSTGSSDAEPSETPSSGPGSSLSGGAIAGIVIGVVAMIAGIALVFFIWGRRKQRRVQRQREEDVRAVSWKDDTRSSASGSRNEESDIVLRDMTPNNSPQAR